MTYFLQNQEINDVPCMSLFYDFRLALELEDYQLCQTIKDEFERRDQINEIDKDFMNALLSFYNKYSSEDKSSNKEHFNKVFSNYLK